MIPVRNPRPAGMSQTQADGRGEEASTTRAALIYQHRPLTLTLLIADAMGKLAEAELVARNASTGMQRPTQ